LTGVGGALLGTGWAVEDGCGATDVDGPGAVERLSGHRISTMGTITAADATAISVTLACLVRYHGGGGARNVKVLLLEARSCPFTVHVLTVGDVSRRVGGEGAGSASWSAS
jgi:hypothetical protein